MTHHKLVISFYTELKIGSFFCWNKVLFNSTFEYNSWLIRDLVGGQKYVLTFFREISPVPKKEKKIFEEFFTIFSRNFSCHFIEIL